MSALRFVMTSVGDVATVDRREGTMEQHSVLFDKVRDSGQDNAWTTSVPGISKLIMVSYPQIYRTISIQFGPAQATFALDGVRYRLQARPQPWRSWQFISLQIGSATWLTTERPGSGLASKFSEHTKSNDAGKTLISSIWHAGRAAHGGQAQHARTGRLHESGGGQPRSIEVKTRQSLRLPTEITRWPVEMDKKGEADFFIFIELDLRTMAPTFYVLTNEQACAVNRN